MKKNISVNLFGTLYNIDEDACDLLQKYEESVRRYFKSGGRDEEVAQDVESRVAELFEELRQQGIEAITITHVQDIIRRIGEPREMDGDTDSHATDAPGGSDDEAAAPDATETPATEAPRKLYRDPDDCMLGGVLSGLAHYFGGSATALRLLVVIIALFVASIPWLIVFYLVCCILIPKAATPEDKLRMMGKPVNLVSLGEGVINGVNESIKQTQRHGCIGQMLSFIALMLKIAFFLCAGFVAIVVGIILFGLLCAALVALAVSIPSFLMGDSALWIIPDLDLPAEFVSDITVSGLWKTIAAILVVCSLPLYAIVHIYRRVRGREQPWSTWVTIACWLVWLASMGLLISFWRDTLMHIQSDRHNYYNSNIQQQTITQDPIDDADADTVAVSDTIY